MENVPIERDTVRQCVLKTPTTRRHSHSSKQFHTDEWGWNTPAYQFSNVVAAANMTPKYISLWKEHIWPTLWPEMSAAWAARGEGVGPRTLGHSQLLLTGLYTTSWLFQPRGQPDGSVLGSTTCWNGAPNSGCGPKPPKKYSL